MSVRLVEPTLGSLEIDDGALGYCVESVEVGGPEVRDVVDPRVLADGTFDRTRFVGARTITINMHTIDDTVNAMTRQRLIDLIAPYLHPGRRVDMYIGFDPLGDPRLLRVRGADWSVPWENPGYLAVTFSWVTYAGPFYYSAVENSVTLGFAGLADYGRNYYEFQLPKQVSITAAEASIETGLGRWQISGGALARSTDRALTGAYSLKLTPSNAGPYIFLRTGTDSRTTLPVVAGQTYTFMASVFTSQAARTCYLGGQWYDAAGVGVGSWFWDTAYPLTQNRWTHLRRTMTAPAGAAFLLPSPSPRGAPTDGSEAFYLDRFGFFAGNVPSSQWSMPGTDIWGREYDRDYPPAPTTVATVVNAGNVAADWRARIDGPVTGFALRNLTTGQGIVCPDLEIPAGDFLLIDSATHTLLADGEPGSSRYSALDFAETDWWLLQPGNNRVSTLSTDFGANAATTITWRDAYM